MNIDLHNYEAFFLDHKEGNLSAAQEQELLAFLERHPELKAELDNFDELVLEPETVFENKSSLKKIEFTDEALIAYAEGVADDRTKKQIEEISAQNTELKKEVALYKSAVLMADPEIKFAHRSKLKKGGVVIYLQSSPAYLRVAAAILLLLGLFVLVSRIISDTSPGNIKPVLANEGKKENKTPSKNNNNILPPQQKAIELAATNEADKKIKKVNNNSVAIQIKKNDPPALAINTVSVTHTIAVNNTVNASDTLPDKIIPAINTSLTDNSTTTRYYYTYSREDDDEVTTVTASAAPVKKTFFQKLTGAARRVNELGLKNVKGEEKQNANLLSIGGLVVSETVSN